ncbi:MAG: response regulator [Deltaproteobacteria bacterium]|nr:response regulator [Deltaproteobacteria bacterium]
MLETRNGDHPLVPEPCPDPARRRVLAVEDEQPLRAVLESLLSTGGHGVRAVATACDALAAFWEDPRAYDVVLVDLDPQPDGALALAEYLHGCRPGLPVVFLGASTGDVERRFRHGGRRHRVLRKPFGAEELMDVVEEVGAYPVCPDEPPAAGRAAHRRARLDCVEVRRLLRQAVTSVCE